MIYLYRCAVRTSIVTKAYHWTMFFLTPFRTFIIDFVSSWQNFRFKCTSSIVTNSFKFKSNLTIIRIYLSAQIVFKDVRNQIYQWLKSYSCLPHIIHVYRCAHLLLQIPSILDNVFPHTLRNISNWFCLKLTEVKRHIFYRHKFLTMQWCSLFVKSSSLSGQYILCWLRPKLVRSDWEKFSTCSFSSHLAFLIDSSQIG